MRYLSQTGWLLFLVLLSTVGCASAELKLSNDLRQAGLAYHNYHDMHKQGPPGWDELISADPMAAESIQRVRDAGYQMKWNVKFSEVSEGLANTVLAERPSGGMKLMMDGSVRQ